MTAPRNGRWRIPAGAEKAFEELQRLPNVGPATAEDLVRLGVRSLRGLARRHRERMYQAICRLDGVRHDLCVLDVFAAVVEFARTGKGKVWWEYSSRRKAGRGASTTARRRRAKPARLGTAPRR